MTFEEFKRSTSDDSPPVVSARRCKPCGWRPKTTGMGPMMPCRISRTTTVLLGSMPIYTAWKEICPTLATGIVGQTERPAQPPCWRNGRRSCASYSKNEKVNYASRSPRALH